MVYLVPFYTHPLLMLQWAFFIKQMSLLHPTVHSHNWYARRRKNKTSATENFSLKMRKQHNSNQGGIQILLKHMNDKHLTRIHQVSLSQSLSLTHNYFIGLLWEWNYGRPLPPWMALNSQDKRQDLKAIWSQSTWENWGGKTKTTTNDGI